MGRQKLGVGLGLAGALVVMSGVGVVVAARQAQATETAKQAKELQNEIDLARKAGIPTTIEEFRKTLPTANAQDNAAPQVLALGKRTLKGPDVTGVGYALTFAPTASVIDDAKAELAKVQDTLDMADKVAEKSRYVADRHYEDGPAVLLPDMASLKAMAKALTLRARLKDAEGSQAGALEDIKKASRIGGFCNQDPLMISHMVGEAITSMVMQTLCELSFRHRDSELYRNALEPILHEQAVPNAHRDLAFELVSALATIDMCATKEGRQRIGLEEETPKQAAAGEIIKSLQTPIEGRTKVVRGFRLMWEASGAKTDHGKAKEGSSLMGQGLMATPAAARLYESLNGGGPFDDVETAIEGRQERLVLWKAVVRGLQSREVAKAIKTGDFVSPVDNKPVRYSFDGKAIEVVGAPDGKSKIIVPRVPKPSTG